MAWIFDYILYERIYISSLFRSLSRFVQWRTTQNRKMAVCMCVCICLACAYVFDTALLDLLLLCCVWVRTRKTSFSPVHTHSIFVLRIPPATKAINQVSCYIYCFTVLYGVFFSSPLLFTRSLSFIRSPRTIHCVVFPTHSFSGTAIRIVSVLLLLLLLRPCIQKRRIHFRNHVTIYSLKYNIRTERRKRTKEPTRKKPVP